MGFILFLLGFCITVTIGMCNSQDLTTVLTISLFWPLVWFIILLSLILEGLGWVWIKIINLLKP